MSKNDNQFPQLFKGFNDLIESFFEDPFSNLFEGNSFRVDVYDTGNDIIIEAELPGFQKDQIKVEPTYQGIRIFAEENSEVETIDEKKNYFQKERKFQHVERFVPIPYTIYPEEIKASYKNGLLEVKLPNKGDKRQKYIDIE